MSEYHHLNTDVSDEFLHGLLLEYFSSSLRARYHGPTALASEASEQMYERLQTRTTATDRELRTLLSVVDNVLAWWGETEVVPTLDAKLKLLMRHRRKLREVRGV